MKFRICGLLAITAFAIAGIIANAQALAQNAYITNADGVSVIDTVSNTVIATIPVSGGTSGVAVSPDGGKVYVTGDDVSVIDTASNTVIATIQVGGFPEGVAVSPDGSKVYVANFYYCGTGGTPGCVSVIDTASNTVIATIIPVGVRNYLEGVAVSPDGSKVYVANSGANSVSVIATASNTVTATIPVGNEPMAFGIFIQPAPQFAGTPGKPNCHGQSVSALAQQYGGLAHAATVLGCSSAATLQNAIAEYCAA